MPERTAEQIRAEIADERQLLDQELTALQRELRSWVPFAVTGVVAGVAAAVVLTKGRATRTGIKVIWKLL